MRHFRAPSPICEHTRDFLTGLVIFLFVFAIAALDSRTARSAEALATGADAATSGTLLMTGAPATPLSNDIRINVTGGIARAVVSQSFQYSGTQAAQGLYVFPLPGTASVDRFDLRVGARSFHSRIVSTIARARAVAQPPVHSLVKTPDQAAIPVQATVPVVAPGLPGHMFSVAVGDVAPGDIVTIHFEYQQTLQLQSGVYSLRFPLSVAGTHEDASAREREIPRRVNLSVRLAAGFDIGDIGSFNHRMGIRRLSESDAVLVLSGDTIPAGRDFELAWSAKAAHAPQASLFVEEAGADAYALAMIAPPRTPTAHKRELILLLDTSGSMTGVAFDQAREAITAAVERLTRHDRFNIIAFNNGLHPMFEAARDANSTNIAAAADFLRHLEPHGGGDMLAAVSTGMKETTDNKTTHLRQVVIVTDGKISTGNDFFAEIAARRGKARLFFAGIGAAPDMRLLRRAAQIGRGDAIHIPERSHTGEMLARLLARIERPAITDLRIALPAGARPDMSPEPLPDVYADEPLMVVIRTAGLKDRIAVTGELGDRPWKAVVSISAATPATGIAAHWARGKIARIEAQRLSGKPLQETAEAIEKLALAHGLTSPVTRLAAVSADPAATPVPFIAARQGIRGFDTGADLRNQVTMARGNVAPVAEEATAVAPAGRTATNYTAIIALSLVFGGMTALTLALWRHLRMSHAPALPRRRRSREWRKH